MGVGIDDDVEKQRHIVRLIDRQIHLSMERRKSKERNQGFGLCLYLINKQFFVMF
jgi:hypothetical protein